MANDLTEGVCNLLTCICAQSYSTDFHYLEVGRQYQSSAHSRENKIQVPLFLLLHFYIDKKKKVSIRTYGTHFPAEASAV
jgi:hypothetical protein